MRQKTERSLVSIVHNDGPADAARIQEMLEESIGLLGGIGKYVKEGDTVVIKGNFFSPAPLSPSTAAWSGPCFASSGRPNPKASPWWRR